MQKVLRKRVLRDLKENFFRYLALGLLIVLCMYIIISLVGAAETVITGVDEHAAENRMEDGEFGVFIPLTKGETKELTSLGITLEQKFYLDYELEDSSTIRVFQNRETMNRVELDEGTQAETEQEIVLEKRYCEEHQLTVGDSFSIGGKNFTIIGIGTTPDYDAPLRNLSDSSVDSQQFGTAFVSGAAYDQLKASKSSSKSEEYLYSYLLNGNATDHDVKDALKKMKLNPEDVEDVYFREYWDETAGKKEEFSDGIQELLDGSEELTNALKKLKSNNRDLQDGADEIFEAFLGQAEGAVLELNPDVKLTEDNYEEVLTDISDHAESSLVTMQLSNAIKELNALKAYKEGIAAYTNGEKETAEGSQKLSDALTELKDKTDELMDQYFDTDISNLTQFLIADENPRIKASADDQVINKMAGLVAGVIIMILFTYVISVFVVHGIERESSVIGALYALGTKKNDLLVHYLMLPVLVTAIAGIIGTAVGFSDAGVLVQMQDCLDYFSLPKLSVKYPAYLIIYGVVMPPLAAAAVNYLVIRKKLSRPALEMIRNETRVSKIHTLNLGNMSFTGRFCIRQMLREARTGLTMIFGMFISLLILMLGINCYVLCEHIRVDNVADTKYDYMYTYKYPEEKVPDGGEACFAKTLKKEIFGYNLDVTVLGIDDSNPYFDTKVEEGKSRAVISSAMAEKYQLYVGQQIILNDEEEDLDYAFTVDGITPYSAGLYLFMDIDSMRDLFQENEDYYNVVFSKDKLDIPSGRLYAVTTRKDIEKSAGIFSDMMMPMVMMMIVVSALIFCVVMYLMMKVMIDRSAFSISLIKIFGYRKKEIRKLYLNGNFYIAAVGAALCIPLSKKLMDTIYPIMISNISCGIQMDFTWQMYVGIYAAILILYLVINQLLVRKLNKLQPADVLKNRE